MIEIDMKMPACCDECFALDFSGDYPCCIISEECQGYNFNVYENRMPSCPLKDNEPRVLTLDEVRDEYEVVWLETKYLQPTVCLVDNGESDADWICFAFGVDDSYPMSWHLCGKSWRCWLSKPTEEQREAVPWDE